MWYVHERQIDAFWGGLYEHIWTIYEPHKLGKETKMDSKSFGDAGHGPEAKQSYRAPGAPEPQRGAVECRHGKSDDIVSDVGGGTVRLCSDVF